MSNKNEYFIILKDHSTNKQDRSERNLTEGLDNRALLTFLTEEHVWGIRYLLYLLFRFILTICRKHCPIIHSVNDCVAFSNAIKISSFKHWCTIYNTHYKYLLLLTQITTDKTKSAMEDPSKIQQKDTQLQFYQTARNDAGSTA